MSDNFDIALAGLASEINALDVQGKGVREAMGHKLIAVRQMLREKNGTRRSHHIAPDGPVPNGWLTWIKDNLSISPSHASTCIKFALDPTGMTKKASSRWMCHSKTGKYPLTVMRRCWSNYTEDEKRAIAEFVRARALEEVQHVVG